MNFDELLTQILDLLRRQGRVSYGALRRRFNLDEEYLADIKTELIDAQRVAADEGGKVLVWVQEQRAGRKEQKTEGEEPRANSEENPESSSQSRETQFLAPSAQSLSAERRQLTVMFCEIGRTIPVEKPYNSEDWQEVLRIAQRTCEEIIGRYEGYLAQVFGDGFIVYWGYPRAHEDDARRAVQAGLDLVRAVQQLDFWPVADTPSVHVRVSLHTGMVIVGDLGEQNRPGPLALGPTPQVAVRLLGVAEPNTVVLSEATFPLIAGYFTCRPLGQQVLPDFSEPVGSYQAVQESGARHRFEAAMMVGLTPFLGREEESNLLLKRWEQVQESRGQVVLLSGEAGIGKSRLIQELKEQLLQEQSICIETRCSPYHQQSAFFPVIDYVQRSLQFGREETGEAKRQKLVRTMTRAHLEEAIPLFAHLLSLPSPPEDAVNSALPPQREKLLHVIISWFLWLAKHKPVLTVWEDLHWADPSTLALLQLLIEQLPTARILAVFTFRPEFSPPWPSRSHVTSLILGRLGSRQTEEMIGNVAKGKPLPEEVKEQIVNKTDGVPLFIEELTKMVIESGLMKEEADAYHLLGPLPPLAIPATLQESSLARLDRLAAAREIAQVGAVLGREFAPEVLHAVLGGDEQALSLALDKLVAAEVLYRRGVAPHVRYVFKHALIQETAYQSLLKGRCQQYHQQIARVLEERFPDTQEAQPELVAYHYTEAGDATRAVPAWQKAGQHAIAQSAFVEAVEHLHKGLAVLKTLPETPEHMQQELQLCTLLGPTLMALKGYSAPEVEATYSRALTLCEHLGETSRRFPLLLGLAYFYSAHGQLQAARHLGEQCFSLAQQGNKPLRLLQAHVILANSLFYQGELLQADEHLRAGIALHSTVQPQVPLHTLHDPGINALSSLRAWTLWCLGYPHQALQSAKEAVAEAERRGRPLSQAIAAVFASGVQTLCRDERAALQHAEQAVALATEQGFSLWAAYGMIMRGRSVSRLSDANQGLTLIQQGLAITRTMGAELVHSWFLLMLGEVYGRVGKIDEGLASVTEALEGVQQRGEQAFAAELYRLKGELTLKQEESQKSKVKSQKSKITDSCPLTPDPQDEAETCFLKAIEIAQRQEAKSWELRATMSLGRLRQKQAEQCATPSTQHTMRSKLVEVHTLLSEVYHWFTEGFDTCDLQEAKTLLESLESSV